MQTNRTEKRWISLLLCLAMLFTMLPALPLQAGAAQPENKNIALGKPVTVSSVEAGTSFSGDYLTDGNYPATDETTDPNYRLRWSSGATLPDTPVWASVDFEQTVTVQSLRIYWQKANSKDYDVQFSQNGQDWDTALTCADENLPAGPYVKELTLDTPVQARYLRVFVRAGNGYANVGIFEIEAFGEQQSLEGVNLALGKPAVACGTEVERFGPQYVTDGKVPETSLTSDPNYMLRWSSPATMPETPVWIYVDLEQERPVRQVNIFWQKANARDFSIEISGDAQDWQEVALRKDDQLSIGPNTDKIVFDKTYTARYVRVTARKGNLDGLKNVGIFEIEVYASVYDVPPDPDEALNEALKTAPTLSPDGSRLLLPEAEGYALSLYGSDNQQVVALDGTVYRPLEDMTVQLLYKATATDGSGREKTGVQNASITIPGLYQPEETDNARPQVLPGIREWKGGQGRFTLRETSRILCDTADVPLYETAKTLQEYFADMLGKQLEIAPLGDPAPGDLVLEFDAGLPVGGEGYEMELTDTHVRVAAPSQTGVLYGGITLLQTLYQDKGRDSAPVGLIRDYPAYEVRSCMIDAGRMYFPLEYLEEMTRYMAWFKLNQIHVHINDCRIQTKYEAFRLESEQYPMLTAKDGSYSKDDYRQYQKNAMRHGISVITEIDTPAHSGSFGNIDPSLILNNDFRHLDLSTPEKYDRAIGIVKDLLDEYLDGDDPVIQSGSFHIGTDEYPTQYTKQFKQYTADLISYVRDKGYEPRLWGSLSNFESETPIPSDATVQIWSDGWANVHTTMEYGFDVINSMYSMLYIVPGMGGYPNYLPLESRYNGWEVTNYGTASVLKGHPQNKGAEFCLWMDTSSYNGGWSVFDVFDRFRDGVMLLSEKTWFGAKAENQTASEFLARVDALGNRAPGVNPARFIESDGSTIAKYDFENTTDAAVADLSPNGYDARLDGAQLVRERGSNALRFDGEGALSLPFEGVGFPYSVAMDVKLEEDAAGATLFSGPDGTLYVDRDGTGHVGFKRSYYSFDFEYTLPKGEWVNLVLTCDGKDTFLVVNGGAVYTAINKHEDIRDADDGSGPRNDSTTFVLPTAAIGKGFVGCIDNLTIMNRYLNQANLGDIFDFPLVQTGDNLALGRPVAVSGVEEGTSFAGWYLTDGRYPETDSTSDPNYRLRWSSNADLPNRPVWASIDLGAPSAFQGVKIWWQKANAKAYDIQVSDDGQNWETLRTYENDSLPQGPYTSELRLEAPVTAQYLRVYVRAGNGYPNVGIFEVEVTRAEGENELEKRIEAARTLLQLLPEGVLAEQTQTELRETLETLEALLPQQPANILELSRQFDLLGRMLAQAEKETVQQAAARLAVPETAGGPFALPTSLFRADTIVWESSNPEVLQIAEDGSVSIFPAQQDTTVTVTATVTCGGAAAERVFPVKVVAPAKPLVITGAPESGSTRSAVTLMAEKEVTWTVNGTEVERASTTIQFRDEGTYTVTARADGAVSETIVFSIDRTAPVLTASVEHYGYTNQDVFFNANEEVTFYNGSEIISEGTELTLTESGTYNIRAIDKAGNYTAFYRVTIMKEAPVLTGAPEGVTRSNIAIRSNVKVLFIVNGVKAEDYAYGLRVLEEGKYTVKAVDMAGNESEEVSFEIDRTKPTFTASVPSGQATGKDITLTANEVVDFVIDGVTVATGTEYTISQSGLTVVRIYDVAGNYGGVYKANIDKSAPVLSAVIEGTNKAVENGATVKQNVTVKTSKASYFIVNDGEPTARANFVKLKASGTYTVKAVDLLGNVSEVFTVTISKP